MSGNAVVAGHVCLDITPVIAGRPGAGLRIQDLMQPGKLMNVGKADIHPGGAVSNTGLGMKVLGANVRLVGKVGQDSFGILIKRLFDEYHAGGSLISDAGSDTSYSIVLAIPGIDRIFLHCPGANDTFSPADISDGVLAGADLFHFGYPSLMRKMYEDNGTALAGMFRHIAGTGIATSLDLAAVDPGSRAAQADWHGIFAKTLPYVDFFVPSFEELCFMLDREKYEKLSAKAAGGDMTEVLDLDRDIRPLADRALSLGAKSVLLKCGRPGLFLKTSARMGKAGSRIGLCADKWNSVEIFEKSFKVSRIRSGTGCGDTSIAAFLSSILEGFGPADAVRMAAAAGALCLTQYDAVSGLKPLYEIKRLVDNGWEKYDA